jgi:apolipoprotein N-acyltransferase
LSFPKFGHPAVAWVALVPLLVAVAGTPGVSPGGPRVSPRGALVPGLLAGAVYFGGTLYWLVDVMTTFGGLATPLAAVVAALLVAYLALFPAAFAVAMAVLVRRLGAVALLLAPGVWVTTELGRTYFWSGFPWVLLGYSQVTVLPVAQLASLVGVFGLSGLVAFVNGAMAYGISARGRRRYVPVLAALVVVVGSSVWGAQRIAREELAHAGAPIRVGLVQGNIAQADKWNPALREAISERYLTLSRDAIRQGAGFVIWPESSTPYYFEEDPVDAAAIRRLAREAEASFLIGSDQLDPSGAARLTEGSEIRYYNAAFLVGPDGETAGVYRKIHLVPFGEYVPLRRLLFFAAPLVETVADFSPGELPVILPVAGHQASTAICYEIIYPGLIRRFVQQGSELLTTITNDAWYGFSSAPYQHFEQAAMRSIEQGRYLARAANTGISGFVDPYGRVLHRSEMFETEVLVADVRFLQDRTFYSRTGDLLAYLFLALTGGALLAAGRMQ